MRQNGLSIKKLAPGPARGSLLLGELTSDSPLNCWEPPDAALRLSLHC